MYERVVVSPELIEEGETEAVNFSEGLKSDEKERLIFASEVMAFGTSLITPIVMTKRIMRMPIMTPIRIRIFGLFWFLSMMADYITPFTKVKYSV